MNKEESEIDKCKDTSFLLWQIMKYWTRGKERSLSEFGITGSQMEMLGAIIYLSNLNEEVTQILLSQETLIDPMTTSTILRNLEKKGLITRTHSQVDTRARVVRMTSKGEKLSNQVLNKHKQMRMSVFKDLDMDILNKQLNILLNAIKKSSNI